jgi:hypothetical protein
VIEWDCVAVVLLSSWQPQKYPGVEQSEAVGDGAGCEVVMGSLQPNQPGVAHVEVAVAEVLVTVGIVVLVLLDVVVSSLQPNQPGVLHVEVEVDVVVICLLVVVAPIVVEVSSRHPHQPGV